MTKNELIKYNDFLLTQMDLTRKKIIKILYRGDSLRNLCDKLNVCYDNQNTDIRTLLARLFMLGEKSNRCYTDDENFRIDETEDYVFNKIVYYIKSSIKNKNKSTISFFDRNKKLKDFFL